MKKSLLILIALVAIGMGRVFMFEDYTEDSLDFATGGTYKLASITFQLDQFSIATVVTGAKWTSSIQSGSVLNGNSSDMSICSWYETPNFIMELESGTNTLDLMFRGSAGMWCIINPRFQVLSIIMMMEASLKHSLESHRLKIGLYYLPVSL